MYSNNKYNNNLNEYTQDIIDLFYPIGRGFIDFTDTDYSSYLGCTWERELVGLTPIGYDPNDSDFNQIGKTLGEKTHTLTINEMPSHSHDMGVLWGQKGGYGTVNVFQSSGADRANIQGSNIDIGGNQPHNNIQPSKIVAYWKRVA